jgi:small subunit ribosomal protein S8
MITDPISDFLTRIRNAQSVGHDKLSLPSSKMKEAISKILKDEDYISDFSIVKEGSKYTLTVVLKYKSGKPSIKSIKRVSTPGRRVYRGFDELPRVLSDLGIAIVSTSAGVMSNKQARKRHLGGEVICEIF